MKAHWLKLAGELLEEAADTYSNHTCNDWDWPEGWTDDQKREIVKAMHEDNGDPEEYNPKQLDVPDWWVMGFLADQLKKEAGE